jgi:hypothetical protein
MPYNPGVQDRSGEFAMQGSMAFGRGIGSGLTGLAEGIVSHRKTIEERDKMTGWMEATGAMDDPAFADQWAKAPYGKQQALFAKGMMDYQQKQELIDQGRKMEQEKAMVEWRANFADKFNQLPDQDRSAVIGLATDYMQGTNEGLEPDQSFIKKVFSLPSKAQHSFFNLLGKGMEVFGKQPQKQVQDPRFVPGPNGGAVMVNPNTGGAQYIKPEEPAQAPSYGTMPAPAPGTVGVMRDGKGGLRVIQPNTGMPVQGTGGQLGNGLFGDSPDAVQQRLNDPSSLDSLFGQ